MICTRITPQLRRVSKSNDFALKAQKPTAQEYLNASLDDIIARLNNNPFGNQSEEALIQAVVTVRAAKINERLSTLLNFLTAIVALATVCLVAVPFIVPSIEKAQLEQQIKEQAQLIESQKDQINNLGQAVSKLGKEQIALSIEVEKYNKALKPTGHKKQPPAN